MKKSLLLALIALMAVACSKEEKEDSGFDNPMEVIYGTWRITHIKQQSIEWLDVTTPTAEKSFKPTYITFRRGGVFVVKGAFGDKEGTYTVQGKTIKSYADDEEFMCYDVVFLEGSRAEFKLYNTGNPYSTLGIRCKKQ